MTKRIAALVFIFLCTTVAWSVLGATVLQRTYSSDSALKGRVASIWGTPQTQRQPDAKYELKVPVTTEVVEDGRKQTRTTEHVKVVRLPLLTSRLDVRLDLEHRQKGLLWHSTYRVELGGTFIFRNTSDHPEIVEFTLPLPAERAIYDDLALTVNDQVLPLAMNKNSVSVRTSVAAGAQARFAAHYRSQGLESWRYKFADDVAEVRDFELRMTTDFKEIDFPEN